MNVDGMRNVSYVGAASVEVRNRFNELRYFSLIAQRGLIQDSAVPIGTTVGGKAFPCSASLRRPRSCISFQFCGLGTYPLSDKNTLNTLRNTQFLSHRFSNFARLYLALERFAALAVAKRSSHGRLVAVIYGFALLTEKPWMLGASVQRESQLDDRVTGEKGLQRHP